MASMKKFTMKATSNQLRHIERTIQNPSNADIDSNRSHLNYSFFDREISSYEYFLHRKAQLHCYNREDVKVLVGIIVTAPKDLVDTEHQKFFQSVFDFLSDRYGSENAVQAIVHNDESGQPHLHFYFIPTVPDKKHGGYKICANDVLTRTELRNFHPALQKYLNDAGIKANINSGITKRQGGNRHVWEMKQERNRNYEHDRTIERNRW